jgi:hypothetical protein
MKKVLVLTVLVALIGINVSYAKDSKKKDETKESRVKELVLQEVRYPSFASEQKIEGTVYVSFTIDNQGKISVLRFNAENQELANYVVEELKVMNINSDDVENEKIYNMKFVFDLFE